MNPNALVDADRHNKSGQSKSAKSGCPEQDNENVTCHREVEETKRNLYEPPRLFDIFTQKAGAIEEKLHRELKIINSFYETKMIQIVETQVSRYHLQVARDNEHKHRETTRIHRDYEEIIQSLLLKIWQDADTPLFMRESIDVTEALKNHQNAVGILQKLDIKSVRSHRDGELGRKEGYADL